MPGCIEWSSSIVWHNIILWGNILWKITIIRPHRILWHNKAFFSVWFWISRTDQIYLALIKHQMHYTLVIEKWTHNLFTLFPISLIPASAHPSKNVWPFHCHVLVQLSCPQVDKPINTGSLQVTRSASFKSYHLLKCLFTLKPEAKVMLGLTFTLCLGFNAVFSAVPNAVMLNNIKITCKAYI